MLDQHLTTDDMHFFTRLRMSIGGFGGNFNAQEASGRVGVDVRGTSRRSVARLGLGALRGVWFYGCDGMAVCW